VIARGRLRPRRVADVSVSTLRASISGKTWPCERTVAELTDAAMPGMSCWR
jgi:hypothetical protein